MNFDDLNKESNTGFSGPASKNLNRTRFWALLVILVLILGFLAVRGSFVDYERGEGVFSMDSLDGDYWMRMYVQYEQQEYRDKAMEAYDGVTDVTPTLSNIRRLIIIEGGDEPHRAIRILEGKLNNADPADTGGLKEEISLWKAIYAGKGRIAREDLRTYAAIIKDMELGWYEYLALRDLYERGGMQKAADVNKSLADMSASKFFMKLGLVLIPLMLIGLGGLCLIALFMAFGRRKQTDISRESVGAIRTDADVLLEVFIVYIILSIVAALLWFLGEWIVTGSVNRDIGTFGEFCIYVLGGVLSLLYLSLRLKMCGISWRSIGFASASPGKDVVWGVLGYVGSLPLLVLAGMLANWMEKYMSAPPNPVVPMLGESNVLLERIVLFVLLVVAAPFFEEIFFRGVLFNSFRGAWGAVAAVPVSAGIFAMVHPLPLGFFPIFVLGSVFAVVMRRRGSLLPSMISHALNNTVAFLMIVFMS